MTIYYYVYASAFQNLGGGEVVLLKTKEYVERKGIRVRLFDQWNDKLKTGDVLHVFGSVKEALGLMEAAKTRGVRIVINPIIWYNWQAAFQIPYEPKVRMLNVLRHIAKTTMPYVPSSRKRMIELGDIVIAASQVEASQIESFFLIPRARIKVVIYGADERYDRGDSNLFVKKYALRHFLLTVGRIEPRKNQLNLIRAIRGLKRELAIIGAPVSHHQDYYHQCKKEAGPNVHFLGPMDVNQDELASAYSGCSLFVLPSWFETPGLAALEAGLAGAKVVITSQGTTQEYFKDMVDYVNPAHVRDIRTKIETALCRTPSDELRNHVRRHYLWQHAADQTINIYRSFGSTGDNGAGSG